MNELRVFLKKNLPHHTLAISYDNTNDINCCSYEYKFNHPMMGNKEKLIFKEYEIEQEEQSIELDYKNNIYKDINEIYLILFELLNYKNIEYIDIYLQIKLKQKPYIYIEDIYNDYYDDINKELICVRNIISSSSNKEEIKKIKLKIVIYNKLDYTLYYNHEVIKDFDNIICKINEIINSL